MTSLNLDRVDRSILAELLRNGRATYAEIGKKIGASSSTVRWKIKRLEESGVVFGYTCLPDIEYFKLNMAIFFIRVSGDLEKVIERLEEIETLTSVVITFGDSNIVCRGVFGTLDDLLMLKDDVSGIEGVGEVQTCITHKGIGMGGDVPLALIRKTDRLDAIDKQLLETLMKDARASYTGLGKKLGLNASTTRLRVKRLIESGVIRRFTARIDLTKLGQFPAFLRIKTRGKTSSVIQELVQIHDVIMAVPCVGSCDVFCRVVVESTEELNELINDKVMRIDGICDVKADCTVKGEKIGGFLPPKMVESRFSN